MRNAQLFLQSVTFELKKKNLNTKIFSKKYFLNYKVKIYNMCSAYIVKCIEKTFGSYK